MFHISKSYPIGERLGEYVPTENLSTVICTGKENVEELFEHDGKTMVINRLLVRKENAVLGAAVFTSTSNRLTMK